MMIRKQTQGKRNIIVRGTFAPLENFIIITFRIAISRHGIRFATDGHLCEGREKLYIPSISYDFQGGYFYNLSVIFLAAREQSSNPARCIIQSDRGLTVAHISDLMHQRI